MRLSNFEISHRASTASANGCVRPDSAQTRRCCTHLEIFSLPAAPGAGDNYERRVIYTYSLSSDTHPLRLPV